MRTRVLLPLAVARFRVLPAVLLWWVGPVGLAAETPARADPVLPAGVTAVWALDRAVREATPTRERVCLNGLWRWQPASPEASSVPGEGWGYYKVPGSWPGITDYQQKDCQTVFAHPAWRETPLRDLTAAWYERDMAIPADWADRRLELRCEYLNSLATVFVDGVRVGELRFPGGSLEVGQVCRPGAVHRLSLRVEALPLREVLQSFRDTASERQERGRVARRGLCGDVELRGVPPGARIGAIRVETSVRRSELSVHARLEGLREDAAYRLAFRVVRAGQVLGEWRGARFSGRDVVGEWRSESVGWRPAELWDLHTPAAQWEVETTLLTAEGALLDAAFPVRTGFRELWIEGRDFLLNGKRLQLSAVPLDNALVGAAWASYAGARESLERLQEFGINYVYAHNYGTEPGSHLGYAEILRAADDVGMLVGFSQPHFSHYDWAAPDADVANGYARHAAFFVEAAQNHPSVVFYVMSHNATGYSEDMNPDRMGGLGADRDTWAERNAARALRAEAIVRRLDPSRISYHHAGGNLGAMHTSNFYPNFTPVQELSDWFETWATTGVKPVFTCEYGAPFSWDWTMYRGWYRGEREFGSARVPWEFCLAEWNAQFLGDRAYRISEAERRNLRWEAAQFREGRVWHRWDYPTPVGSSRFEERFPVFATYLRENWRAFRTWGVSAISPWDHGHFWKVRDGVDRGRRPLPVDWENLQRPGFSADYLGERYERMDLAFERSDWIATEAAEALRRNNRPLLGYLAGKPARFTSKDHLVLPGETLEKQLVILNNARERIACTVRWQWAIPVPPAGQGEVSVDAGGQARLPLRLEVPHGLAPGAYPLHAEFRFGTGEVQEDAFVVHVLPVPRPAGLEAGIALWDPVGETAAWFDALGLKFRRVDAAADVPTGDLLIVGKAALTLEGPAPDLQRVRQGQRVLIFEQRAEVLEKRLGLRTVEYGLRQVFPRVPDHPVLAGLEADHLADWRGESTLTPRRLEYELRPRHGPTVRWCDLPVTRAWRCGNQGNVASVLVEKPTCGDVLPILEGGFGLQYAPLLEIREGRGVVLLCQVDVTGRTEPEPAAAQLTRNLLRYVEGYRAGPRRAVRYAGDAAGLRHLASAGFPVEPYAGGPLTPDTVLVLGPGAGPMLEADRAVVSRWQADGGRAVRVGGEVGDGPSPVVRPAVQVRETEYIATWFAPPPSGSPFTGIGPADVHNRDVRRLPLVVGGADLLGDGVLAAAEGGREDRVLFPGALGVHRRHGTTPSNPSARHLHGLPSAGESGGAGSDAVARAFPSAARQREGPGGSAAGAALAARVLPGRSPGMG